MKTFKGMLFYASAIALSSSFIAHAQEADDSERKLKEAEISENHCKELARACDLKMEFIKEQEARLESIGKTMREYAKKA